MRDIRVHCFYGCRSWLVARNPPPTDMNFCINCLGDVADFKSAELTRRAVKHRLLRAVDRFFPARPVRKER